jgi:hypothetical protein
MMPGMGALSRGRPAECGKPLHRSQLQFVARPARFERTTPAFGGQYSIQLSYGRGRPKLIFFGFASPAELCRRGRFTYNPDF